MATPKSKQGSKNAFWWSLETAKKEGYVLIDVNTMHIEFRNTTCILQEVVFDGDISGELTVPTGKSYVCLCNHLLRPYMSHRGVRIYSRMANVVILQLPCQSSSGQIFAINARDKDNRVPGLFCEVKVSSTIAQASGDKNYGVAYATCRNNHEFMLTQTCPQPLPHCRNTWQGKAKVQQSASVFRFPPPPPTPPEHIEPSSTSQSTGTIATFATFSGSARNTMTFKERAEATRKLIEQILEESDSDSSDSNSSETSTQAFKTPPPAMSSMGAEGVTIVDVDAQESQLVIDETEEAVGSRDIVKTEPTSFTAQPDLVSVTTEPGAAAGTSSAADEPMDLTSPKRKSWVPAMFKGSPFKREKDS